MRLIVYTGWGEWEHFNRSRQWMVACVSLCTQDGEMGDPDIGLKHKMPLHFLLSVQYSHQCYDESSSQRAKLSIQEQHSLDPPFP